ncbi:MAG: hypothetical protein H7246_03460 [Phycisphaerae bacterium]|nr:hypothetical protein [Saprospiraceae bacterium]
MKQYRYPGAQPFSTAQEDIFYGRDDDIARLHRLIKTEPLVVLHAKSGMGKSSLLNAGIVPAILREEEYFPVHIRFNAWTEGKTDLPADISRKAISPEGSKHTFLDSLIENEASLWHEIKENQLISEGKRKYLLLLDQFEELFTYPPEAIAEFRNQLAEVLYTRIPQRYRKVLESQIEAGNCKLKDNDFDRLQEPIAIRILLSVRSDRLHLMDRLSDSLPDILAHCYELKALEPTQATDAVVEPARKTGNFLSPAFTYSSPAVAHILDFLDDSEGRIETVQLQILCRTLELRAQTEGVQHFEKDTLGDLDDIISNFYQRQIAILDQEQDRSRVSRLIEEGLIVAEDRQRLTLHEALIVSLFQVPREHLAKLVDGGLLRAEPALRGGYAYELSHDTLVGPALEARTQRREREAGEARDQQEREVARALAKERYKRRRSRNLAIIFALLALLSLSAAGWAFRQTLIANAAETNAQLQQQVAEAQEKEAKHQKNKADENSQIALLNAKNALDAQEKAELQRLLAEKSERVVRQLANKGKRLETTISSAETYNFLMQEGRKNMGEGNYRNALTNFATARFTQETPESNTAIEAAKIGVAAEKAMFTGDLDMAEQGFLQLRNDSSEFVKQRLKAIQHSNTVFKEKLNGRQPEALDSLKLTQQSLIFLPASLGDFSNLKKLDLSLNSDLTYLPASLGRLKNLRILVVKFCNLLEVPESIEGLQSLLSLDLSHNQSLEKLPSSLGQLRQLEELNVEGCALKALPMETGGLANLVRLNLSKTSLPSLPVQLEQLKRLEELKMSSMTLGQRFNWVDALSRLERLTSLRSLDLSRNNLHQANPEVLLRIAKLQQLHSLNLQYTELKSLPPEIANLKNLKSLNLQNNPSIGESARAQIRSWLPGCTIKF